MSRKEMQLLNLLCEKVGISTVGELEAFKLKTKVTSNEMLIKRLALYVAADAKFNEFDTQDHIFY